MASSGSLDPVRLKISWAKKHREILVSEMHGYFKKEPCHIVTDIDPVTNIAIASLVIRMPIPVEFALILGDCVQNIRTALDYLVWELVLAANNSPSEKNAPRRSPQKRPVVVTSKPASCKRQVRTK